MKKKVWTLIVAALIAVTASLIAGGVFALETDSAASGDCGDVHWEFDEVTGHISFTGSGKMPSYTYYGAVDRPWNKYASKIKSATIGDGITTVGGGAFKDCTSLTSVEIADTVTYFDWWSFSGCYNLKSIEIPENVTSLFNGVFNDCYKLSSIVIPESMNTINFDAFTDCYALKNVYVNSPNIAKALNTYDACGHMIYYADTVYIRSDISNIPDHIPKVFPNTFQASCGGVTYNAYSKNTPVPNTLQGYIQLCPGEDTYDMRFLVEGDSEYLTHYTKATVTLTFTKNGDPTQTKKMEAVANQAYTSVLANGKEHPARDGYGFVGLVIEDIGKNDVAALSASVTLTAANGDWVQYELGSVKDVLSHLQNPAA